MSDSAVVDYLDPDAAARSGVPTYLMIAFVSSLIILALVIVFEKSLGCKWFNWSVNGCPALDKSWQPDGSLHYRLMWMPACASTASSGPKPCLSASNASVSLEKCNHDNVKFTFEKSGGDAWRLVCADDARVVEWDATRLVARSPQTADAGWKLSVFEGGVAMLWFDGAASQGYLAYQEGKFSLDAVASAWQPTWTGDGDAPCG